MKMRKLLVAMTMTIGMLVAVGSVTASAVPSSSPDGAAADGQAAVAAVTPTIWPPAERIRYWSAGSRDCPYKRLCVVVWDPTRNDYKIFDLYACGPYRLSNWLEFGQYENNQTAGTVGRFLDRNGFEVHSTGPAWDWGGVNWDPVWSIRAC